MNCRVTIVEDNDNEAERLNEFFMQYQNERDVAFDIIRYSTAEAFLERSAGLLDLVMMDVMLPGMNGMDAATQLRMFDPAVTLIFVTNMAQYAVKGYEVDAFDFIVKPVRYPHFVMKMDRFLKKLIRKEDKYIALRLSDRMMRVSISDILYVEVRAHSLLYHTESGVYTVYGTMKKEEEKLAAESFARCNNCYLVNLAKVQSIDGYDVNVAGELLKISRSKRKLFLEQLNKYLGEN